MSGDLENIAGVEGAGGSQIIELVKTSDKHPMTPLADNAAKLLDTAECSARPGETLTVIINREGAIRVIVDSDWGLDALAAHHGAAQAYRVERREGRVRVEGREGTRRCVLEAETRASATRRVSADLLRIA